MALITIPFSFPLNVSVDVGDTAYIARFGFNVSGQSGAHVHSNQSDIIEIGEIIEISPLLINDESFIIVDETQTSTALRFFIGNAIAPNDFIMFSKDNKVNLSNILGYYAKVKMINDLSGAGKAAELFSVGAEVTQSSK